MTRVVTKLEMKHCVLEGGVLHRVDGICTQ